MLCICLQKSRSTLLPQRRHHSRVQRSEVTWRQLKVSVSRCAVVFACCLRARRRASTNFDGRWTIWFWVRLAESASLLHSRLTNTASGTQLWPLTRSSHHFPVRSTVLFLVVCVVTSQWYLFTIHDGRQTMQTHKKRKLQNKGKKTYIYIQ